MEDPSAVPRSHADRPLAAGTGKLGGAPVRKRRLRRGLLLALALYALYAAGFWHWQRALLYPGTARAADPEAARRFPDAQVEWIPLGEARIETWYLPPLPKPGHDPAARAPARAPALIVAHGNGELIEDWPRRFEPFRRLGLGLLLVEYPGYGRSGGTPDEAGIRRLFAAAWDRLAARPDIDPARIGGLGISLGGGAIGTLIPQRPLAAVILLSTFTDIGAFAGRYGLPRDLVLDPYDTRAALAGYDAPVLVIHGRRDGVIPYAHAQALAAAGRHATLHLHDCAHVCWEPERLPLWAELEAFLRRTPLLPASVHQD